MSIRDIEEVYPDTIEERAQEYMRTHSLGFVFLEDGRMIVNDDCA